MSLDRLAALASRYAIVREIGRGGMATVYLADDLKHPRKVAIKVLHADLAHAVGGERFLREIRVTAQLDHPHILSLLDSGEVDGLLYYAMPFVDGESLRDRLEREKQLPVDDALQIAREVADALSYAHAHGIVHRDIKPENILLSDEHARVADFGIARAVTGGEKLTATGLSIGTPAYMSPEQASGERSIDARSDIYALGCVLYEMLAGQTPFTGPTADSIVRQHVSAPPPLVTVLRPSVPSHVAQTIARALAKTPADRFEDARELSIALRAPAHRSALAPRATAGEVLRHPVAWALAGIAVGGTAVAISSSTRDPEIGDTTAVVVPITIPATQGTLRTQGGSFAVSPDGKAFAYRAGIDDATSALYVRRSNDTVGRPIPGTAGAGSFTFAPDGKALAFVARDSALKQVTLDGSEPRLIVQLPAAAFGIAWGRELVIALRGRGLWTVPPSGGTLTRLTKSGSAHGQQPPRWPVVLADSETVLYSIPNRKGTWCDGRIGVASLRTRESTQLDLPGIAPLGVVSRTLVYMQGAGIIAGVPFDVKTKQVGEQPQVLAERVGPAVGVYQGVFAALSQNGTLVMRDEGTREKHENALVAMDGRTRRFTVPGAQSALEVGVGDRISPDGKRLAQVRGERDGGCVRRVWTVDLATGSETLLTRDSSSGNARIEWTSDSRSVHYLREGRERNELWIQPADGSSPPRLLQAWASAAMEPYGGAISAGGEHLVFRTEPLRPDSIGRGSDLWFRRLSGDTTPRELAADPIADEFSPAISPDGKMVAYTSNAPGSENVYVREIANVTVPWRVSAHRGTNPMWSPDSRKLFFVSEGQMMEATVDGSSPPRLGQPQTLFTTDLDCGGYHPKCQLAFGGAYFVGPRLLEPARPGAILVFHNWFAEVRAKLSVKRR